MTWKEIALHALSSYLMVNTVKESIAAMALPAIEGAAAKEVLKSYKAFIEKRAPIFQAGLDAEKTNAKGTPLQAPYVDTRDKVRKWTNEYNVALKEALERNGEDLYTINMSDVVDHAVRNLCGHPAEDFATAEALRIPKRGTLNYTDLERY